MLLRLEPTCRSAVTHHVDRTAPLGTWVIISETWYNCHAIAVQRWEHGEGQNYPAILRLFEIAPKQIGNRPDKRRQRLMVQRTCPPCVRSVASLPGSGKSMKASKEEAMTLRCTARARTCLSAEFCTGKSRLVPYLLIRHSSCNFVP